MTRFLVTWGLLIIATTMESTGDALVRVGIFERTGAARVGLMALGGLLLFGYGCSLNFAPMPFERVVGLYIATLFTVWQLVSYFTFRSLPSLPIMTGGALIIAGGLIVTFWRQG